MKKVHFLGIGGSGISAIAKIAEAQGFEISGCDLDPNTEFTTVFDQNQILQGHSPEHLKGVDILAVSPAIYSLDPTNPELLAAKEKNIPVMNWKEFLAKYLEKDHFVIAVSGTHGKSTTTAMIGKILEDAGFDPTVALGAIVPSWGKNFRLGQSKYFVVEADEFNRDFLFHNPDITVVTAIEMDHPETYKNFDEYKESFSKFFSQTKDKIIANLSYEGVKETLDLSKDHPAVIDYSKELIDFEILLPGQHNILNASAAYQVGLSLKIKPEVIRKSLENFSGVARRFEYLGSYKDTPVYSDFGHHPTEIKVTLETARIKFPDKKITVIFQPHMFSRTKALFNEFVDVLKRAPVDQIFVLDIYPSREIDTGLVTSKELVEKINQENIISISGKEQLFNKLKTAGTDNEILFFIGAGDTHNLANELIKD